MTVTVAIIGILALIAILLFAIWRVLRFAAWRISELAEHVHDFLNDYEQIYNFKEKKILADEVAVDQDFAEWKARQAKEESK